MSDSGYFSFMSDTKQAGSLDHLFPSSMHRVSRSTSCTRPKRQSASNTLHKAAMRQSSLIGRPQSKVRPQSSSIMRVDIPPAINTSIHTLDTLFLQYHSDSSREDKSGESDTDGSSKHDDESEPQSAHTSTSSEPTLFPINDTDDTLSDRGLLRQPAKEENVANVFEKVLDALFPYPRPDSSLHHVYYNVATVDGEPNIPLYYDCSIAMCTARFRYFESLQQHWTTHPWNRRSILLPVTAGGLRRLGFWQHKARFFKSLVQGPHNTENTKCESNGNTVPLICMSKMQRVFGKKQSSSSSAGLDVSGTSVITSDYGDIRLLGPSSFFVSPRVLSAEQVRVWEETRDKYN